MHPANRSEAKALLKTHYFTGKKCKYGHVCLRRTLDGSCIECNTEKSKKWAKDNPDKIISRGKKYYRENREKCLERSNKWRGDNIEKARSKQKEYREKNKEKYREQCKVWRSTNRVRIKKTKKEWELKNPDKVKAMAKRFKEKRRKDPNVRLTESISNRIRQTLAGKKFGRTWQEVVGFTLEDLISHLVAQFTSEMTWDNYGSYWHIDHIRPISLYEKENRVLEGWKLENLQPLKAEDNLSKGSKYEDWRRSS